ncbi:MAG: methylmalonyl-CoA epimerase [Gemmatimonadaceae bacterium]|nr:methylmalonyl-CoA epimerase [Gemmatimonadaceae bacterium]
MTHPTGPATRIAHVGIALSAIDAQLPFYRDVLGLESVPVSDSDGARIEAFDAGGSLVELLESSDGGSPIGRFIARRGPGIHHICFAVPDLEAVLEKCRAKGVELVDQVPRIGAEGKRIAFLHPRSTGGILVELTED